jgi:ABC-type sugar transport system ATPase subunit
VAIGRAIVRHPEVFLFDEPLSNLDAALRVEMRLEIERLHRELDTTMIYVTHDQVEAMTLADRIVVLENGSIQQIGAPMDLYRAPANRFVAEFIGSPRMNVMACDALGHSPVPDAAHLGVRPEDFSVATGPPAEGRIGIPATVRVIERLGGISFGYFQTRSSDQIIVQLPGETALEGGQAVTLGFDPAQAHVFARDGTTLKHRRA